MENKHILNQVGQTAVEYILLVAVLASIIGFVFRSEQFQAMFGEDGQFADSFRKEIEFSYRHALYGRENWTTPNYNQLHKSYQNPQCGNKTRFFSAADPYPAN